MMRFFGAVFLVVLVIGVALRLSGPAMVALMFFSGCLAIVLAIVARMFMRYW